MTHGCHSAVSWVDALRTAARWRLIGLAFECPAAGWREQLASLAEEVDDDAMRRLAQAAAEEAAPELYHTTFGPGGPATPREVSYVDTIMPGQLLGDVQAFYDAFAYRPAIDEPADHIAVELGFVGYLHLKTAYALARGDAPQAELAAEAAQRFVAEHLRSIVGPLGRLVEASQIGYLQLAAGALQELADFGVPPASNAAIPPAASWDDLPILDGCDDPAVDEMRLEE